MYHIFIIPKKGETIVIHNDWYCVYRGADSLVIARFEARMRGKEARKKDKSAVVHILEL